MKKIIIGALIVVGLASIAYAAFSQQLTISGTGSTKADWDVKITGITHETTNGVTLVTPVNFSDTQATFDVELTHPGAEAVFEVTIANEGGVDAILDSIAGLDAANAANPADIEFTLSGVKEGETTLDSGSENIAIVTVKWKASSTLDTDQSKTATINFNYVQNT